MRSVIGSACILRFCILTRRLVFFFLAMMLDDAAGRGPENCMMAGDMTDDSAHGGSLQATLGTSNSGQDRETDGNRKAGGKLVHLHSSGGY
jgi:hypothetical protein